MAKQRFWSKVDRRGPDECWLWVGGRSRKGYGRFRVGSNVDGSRRMAFAHRFAWELVRGPIPDGLCVCHRCDNPPCCNPAHLWLGTKGDNAADRDAKGRLVHVAHPGELNGNAKLSEADALAICRLYATGQLSHSSLARRFDVSKASIRRVVNGETWKVVSI